MTDSVSSTPPSKTYHAAVIVIGNEILTGRTQDTNTPWIAEKLGPRGVVLREVRVIPDEDDKIIAAVNELRARNDYVITTGGIGPTHDDITTEAVARAFGVKTHIDPDARSRLLEHYGNEEELTAPRLKMATVPVGAMLIDNPVSNAPGFRIENVFVLAGVPRIMQAMLDHVMSMMEPGIPYLSTTVSCGLAEGKVAEDLEKLQKQYPQISIGSYPHYRGGVLGLSLVLRGTNVDDLHRATDALVDIIRAHGDEPRAISRQSKTA